VFPGGCLPSLEVISRSVARGTDLRQVHLEDITAHYAETLSRWRESFLAASEQVSALGYDQRFRRLWEFYLSYCEGGFRERRIQDVQLMLAKPAYREEPLPAFASRPTPTPSRPLTRLRTAPSRLADSVAAIAAPSEGTG